MGDGAAGGNGSDFLVVSLVNGVVRASMNLQDGMPSATVNIETQLLYNDSEVHELEVTRTSNFLRLAVDDERVSREGKLCSICIMLSCYSYACILYVGVFVLHIYSEYIRSYLPLTIWYILPLSSKQ